MASESMTAADYIKHHLQNLTSLSDVTEGQGLKNIADFSFINIDSLFFSILLGVVGSYLLYRAAQRATSGVPGRFQAAVEILFEFVDDMCKSIIPNEKSRKAVAPVGLTCHGYAARGLIAARIPRHDRRVSCIIARCAHRRFKCYARHRHRRFADVYLLQHQNQNIAWLGA